MTASRARHAGASRLPTALALGVILGLFAPLAIAAEPANPLALGNSGIYEKSLAALTLLFVVAVLLESAFSAIFDWSVFLAYFSRTGTKTLVMVVVSLIVVNVFEIDILASLVSAYKAEPIHSGALSKFITALILSGGSAGVYNLMHALGYRNDSRTAQMAARPPKDKAWVSVRVKRVEAVGAVQVTVRALGLASTYAGGASPSPIAGTVSFNRRPVVELFLRSSSRFPQSGGHELAPDTVYQIDVEGIKPDGTVIRKPVVLGSLVVLAPGAIADFAVDL